MQIDADTINKAKADLEIILDGSCDLEKMHAASLRIQSMMAQMISVKTKIQTIRETQQASAPYSSFNFSIKVGAILPSRPITNIRVGSKMSPSILDFLSQICFSID